MKVLKAFFLFVLFLMLVVPILGQEVEVTDAALSPTMEVVAGVEPVVLPPVVVAPVAAADDAAVQVNLVQVIIGLLTAFSAGGIIGIAGLALFVERINKNTSTVTALELLQTSWPPETRDLLLGISKGLESIGKLGKEVFDDVPVAEKETPPLTPTP